MNIPRKPTSSRIRKIRRRKKIKKIIRLVIFLVILIVVMFCFDMLGWSGSSESVTIAISENDNVTVVCEKLEKSGVILNQQFFKLYYKITKSDATIHPGDIKVSKNSSYKEIVDAIAKPESDTITVTIPEGFELREIAKRLLEKKLISNEDEFYSALDNFTLTLNQNVAISGKDMLAGFLFPDTYEFKQNVSCESIIQKMTSNFKSKWTDELDEKAKLLDMDVEEVIILSSIVEREAREEEDFPIVAAVFLNRLENEKPLESCATVQFILQERKSVLSVEDTLIESPYNTYQKSGLPPTPISAPGMRAISSVLNPTETDYLYFFTDQNGENHYSKSYQEHISLIQQFGLTR